MTTRAGRPSGRTAIPLLLPGGLLGQLVPLEVVGLFSLSGIDSL